MAFMLVVCHNLHNACKNLCNMEAFKLVSSVSQLFKSDFILILWVITKLHELLAFMSLFTFTFDHFDKAQKDCKITWGLQSVGEIQFVLIYWSLQQAITSTMLSGCRRLLCTITHHQKLDNTAEALQKLWMTTSHFWSSFRTSD